MVCECGGVDFGIGTAAECEVSVLSETMAEAEVITW